MRILFTVLGLLIATISFSQVRNQTIISRYMELWELNSYSDKFEKTAEDWTRTEMQFHDDYYFISIDNGDIGKVYWEFDRRTEDGQDIYYTETGYKFLFDYDEQKIYFWSEYSDYKEIYTKVLILSKISSEE